MKKKLYQTGAIILSSIMVAGTSVPLTAVTAAADNKKSGTTVRNVLASADNMAKPSSVKFKMKNEAKVRQPGYKADKTDFVMTAYYTVSDGHGGTTTISKEVTDYELTGETDSTGCSFHAVYQGWDCYIREDVTTIPKQEFKAEYIVGQPVPNHIKLSTKAFKVTLDGKAVTDFTISNISEGETADVYQIDYQGHTGYCSVPVITTQKIKSRVLRGVSIAGYHGPKTLPEGYMPKAEDFDVNATYDVTGTTDISGFPSEYLAQPILADRSTETEKITDFTVSGRPATGGKNTYTVSYRGKAASVDLTCMTVAKMTLDDKDISAVYTGKKLKDKTVPDKSDIAVKAKYRFTTDDRSAEINGEIKDYDLTYLRDRETIRYPGGSEKYNVWNITFTGKDGQKHTTTVDIPVEENQKTPEKTKEKMTLTGITAVYNGKDVTVGSVPSKSDFTVTASYTGDKGTKETEKVTDFTISGSNSKAGKNKYTVTYNKKSADVYVTFVDKKKTLGFKAGDIELMGISASYSGKKVKTGSTPKTDDVKVTGKYRVYTDDNGHYTEYDKKITGFTMSGRGDMTGDVKFTITYRGKTADVIIPYEKADKDILVSTKSSLSAKYHGTDLLTGTVPAKSDFTVTQTNVNTYKDGSKKTKNTVIQAAGGDTFTISGVSTAGTNNWTVSYKGMTATVPVTFYNASENNISSMTVKSLTARYTGKTVQEGTWPDRKDFAVIAKVEYTYRNGQKETKDITVPASGLDTFVLGGSVKTGVNGWLVSYGDKTTTVSVPFAHVKDKTSGSTIKKNTSDDGKTKKNTAVKKTSKKKKSKAKKSSCKKKIKKNSRKTAKRSKKATKKHSSKRAKR